MCLLYIVYIDHRLALASADAADEVDYFGVYKTTIQSLHNYMYINQSSVQKEELVLWQETCEEPVLTMKRSCAAFLP